MSAAPGPAEKPPSRGGGPIGALCRVDYGHRPHCSPGPVVVHGWEILPRTCFCPCHEEEAS